jgi:hypothetical protein
MLGVSPEILEEDYMLQIAVLEDGVMENVDREFIEPWFHVDFSEKIPHIDDYRDIHGLEVRPPDVWRYFVRVKSDVLDAFIARHGLEGLSRRKAEDEFVYQNTFRLNKAYYDAFGKQRAFVLSHGRNFFILKIVGYAEQVVQYYKLDDFKAHIWIAHQRYPTKGRVWHPAGAHPFIGLNEALVHNGDFANYHSVVEYLRQRNIHPLFLTDTEVSCFSLICSAGPTAIPWSMSSKPWLQPWRGILISSLQRSKNLQGPPGDPHPCLSRRSLVFHHRQKRCGEPEASTDRHHGYRHAQAPGVRSPRRPGSGGAHLFGKAGH